MKYIRQEKKNKNAKYDNGIIKADKAEDLQKGMEFEEYFQYTPSPSASHGISAMSRGNAKSIKLAKDAVTYCTSGLVDRNKNTVLSYLHKAIKALNQLRMIEDSLVIYQFIQSTRTSYFLY